MKKVVEQLTPNPVSHDHGENGCCPDPRAWEMESKTNGDRIRSMTDEELVDVIGCPLGLDADICFPQKSCAVCMLKWLRSPVEGSEK